MSNQDLFRASSVTDLLTTLSSKLPDKQNQKVFFVSGGAFAEPIIAQLRGLGIEVTVFDDFSPNPLYEDVVAGVESFKASQADLVVSLGGGSAIDTAKCILLFSTVRSDGNRLKAKYGHPSTPHFAIPTTAGTGSEATTFAVVYYEDEKYSVDSPGALPTYVVLVPELLRGLPLYHKRATFLDALCQAIESLWSVNSTDESKKYARRALAAIMDNYQEYFVSDDDSITEIMLEAAYAAGQAINISKTTAAHAMSYQLSSLYGIAHGHAAALCLPKVWRYMINHVELCADPRGADYLDQIFSELDDWFNCKDHNESIEWFEALLEELNMYPPDSENPEDFAVLAGSVNAQRLANNPIPLSDEVIDSLYRQIIPEKDLHACQPQKKKKMTKRS